MEQLERPYGIAPPGYRLPDATHVGRVRLQVSDLERSVTYYTELLGFRLVDRAGGQASLAAGRPPKAGGGDGPVLVELVERAGATAAPRRGRLGLYHFAILLPERAALGRFVSHLGEVGARAGMSDHFVSEAVYLQDPDNLGIEVYADRPRSAWQHAGGQLVMSTEPLDVESLVRAGAGERWSGMPAGTTIGHVHLHVGDIETAAAFYHAGLGLDKVVWSYPGALFLSAGGYHHHLGTNTWAVGAAPAAENEARLIDWEVVVPRASDADAAARSVEAAGYGAERASRGWLLRDPWGTQLRVVAEV